MKKSNGLTVITQLAHPGHRCPHSPRWEDTLACQWQLSSRLGCIYDELQGCAHLSCTLRTLFRPVEAEVAEKTVFGDMG